MIEKHNDRSHFPVSNNNSLSLPYHSTYLHYLRFHIIMNNPPGRNIDDLFHIIMNNPPRRNNIDDNLINEDNNVNNYLEAKRASWEEIRQFQDTSFRPLLLEFQYDRIQCEALPLLKTQLFGGDTLTRLENLAPFHRLHLGYMFQLFLDFHFFAVEVMRDGHNSTITIEAIDPMGKLTKLAEAKSGDLIYTCAPSGYSSCGNFGWEAMGSLQRLIFFIMNIIVELGRAPSSHPPEELGAMGDLVRVAERWSEKIVALGKEEFEDACNPPTVIVVPTLLQYYERKAEEEARWIFRMYKALHRDGLKH